MALILSVLGIFVVLKKMSFFSSGIAHASLAGVAIGIVAGVDPMVAALFFGVIFSVTIYFIEKKYNLAADTAIGILFTSGMALGVLIISIQPGYQPELLSFLFGNILSIRSAEAAVIFIAGLIIFSFVIGNIKGLLLVSLDPETAYVSGINVEALQVLFYAVLGAAVILGIKVLGVVLVSALLIIPVSIAKLFAGSFKELLMLSVIISEIIVVLGIIISYLFDLPTGPTIVLSGTVLFGCGFLLASINNKTKKAG